jgi:mannosyltransferase
MIALNRENRPLLFWRMDHFILLALLIVAAMVRLHQNATISYIFDESFSWKLIQYDWAEMIERVARDNHPPLYFILLKAWGILFGMTPFALRSLAAVCGVFSVWGAWLLTKECLTCSENTADSRSSISVAAGTAAALVALNPLQIEWSQYVRMYSMGTALSLFSCWFLLRALHGTSRPWINGIGFLLTATALLYTHYYGLFIVAAQGLYLIGRVIADLYCRAYQELKHHVIVGGTQFILVGLLWLPWLPVLLRHRQQVVDDYWSGPFAWRSLANFCFQFVAPLPNQLPPAPWIGWLALIVVGGLIAGLLILGGHGGRLLSLAALVTLAAAIGISLSSRSILAVRYLVFAQALLFCGLSILISRIRLAGLQRILSAAVVLLMGWSCWAHLVDREQVATRPGFSAAVAYLDSLRDPSEAVLVADPMVQVTVAAYSASPGKVFVLGQLDDFPYYHGTAIMKPEEFVTAEQAANWKSSRLWIVDTQNWIGGTLTTEIPVPWIDVEETPFLDHLYKSNCQIIVRECVRSRSGTHEETAGHP